MNQIERVRARRDIYSRIADIEANLTNGDCKSFAVQRDGQKRIAELREELRIMYKEGT